MFEATRLIERVGILPKRLVSGFFLCLNENDRQLRTPVWKLNGSTALSRCKSTGQAGLVISCPILYIGCNGLYSPFKGLVNRLVGSCFSALSFNHNHSNDKTECKRFERDRSIQSNHPTHCRRTQSGAVLLPSGRMQLSGGRCGHPTADPGYFPALPATVGPPARARHRRGDRYLSAYDGNLSLPGLVRRAALNINSFPVNPFPRGFSPGMKYSV